MTQYDTIVSMPTKELVFVKTISVDLYFDELISLVLNNYAIM